MDLRIDISQVTALAKKYQGAAPIVADELVDAMARSTNMVRATAVQIVPVDTGRLKGTITAQPVQHVGTSYVGQVGPNTEYAAHVEFGTRPHWPPPGALDTWATRHGFPGGGVGDFLVRRAIAMRGTKAHPYMRPALEQNVAKIRAEFDAVALRVLRRLGARP